MAESTIERERQRFAEGDLETVLSGRPSSRHNKPLTAKRIAVSADFRDVRLHSGCRQEVKGGAHLPLG
jgi:hypothetical protein